MLFVGDYIDRGPKIKEVLRIVRGMVENDRAIALMGNHEYNAICFQLYPEREGGHLRKHLIKNVQQYENIKGHLRILKVNMKIYRRFMLYPLFYEKMNCFRAVHAYLGSQAYWIAQKSHQWSTWWWFWFISPPEKDSFISCCWRNLKGKELNFKWNFILRQGWASTISYSYKMVGRPLKGY